MKIIVLLDEQMERIVSISTNELKKLATVEKQFVENSNHLRYHIMMSCRRLIQLEYC